MSSVLSKILLSPRSLSESGLQPHEATLQRVINLLSLPKAQRSSKLITLLQALTKKIKFFIQKVSELGPHVHYDSCKAITYEFIPAGEVNFYIQYKIWRARE